jgi:hypothetical protein
LRLTWWERAGFVLLSAAAFVFAADKVNTAVRQLLGP